LKFAAVGGEIGELNFRQAYEMTGRDIKPGERTMANIQAPRRVVPQFSSEVYTSKTRASYTNAANIRR